VVTRLEARLPILESTPLRNPFWQYSRDKIACEDLLVKTYRQDGFPLTIIRPSHTYDRTSIALTGGWTDIARLRAGKPVVVHGDGTSLWTLTHASDVAKALVGLFGLPQAIGDSTVPFALGARQVLNWFDANPDQQIVDERLNATFDQLITTPRAQ